MVGIAEERSKIALIDLMRLLFKYEASAAHILNRHWETFDLTIFQYLLCVDTKDPSNKVLHNFHLVSLKMLANIYQTSSGLDFMMADSNSAKMLDFCTFSITSSNPKTVYHAAVLAFNHILCFKRDLKVLSPNLMILIEQIIDILDKAYKTSGLSDDEAITALVLCEIRMLYKNKDLSLKVLSSQETNIVKVHSDLKSRATNNSVKETIDDLELIIVDGLSYIGKK
jgi:hypothetical protein